jgi:hypothetical protein
MKKGIMIFALLLAGGFCFAQTSEGFSRVNSLLRSGLNKNYSAIQAESFNLDEAERLRLYNAYDMGSDKMWIGAGLNFFVGFGVGNFYQKDYLAGGITLGGTVAGLGLLFGGYAVFVNELVNTVSGSSSTGGREALEKGLPLYIAGGLVLSTAQIFGLVRTFVFPSSYNNKLRNALNVQGLVLNIEPSLNITDNGYELALVHFRY